jgi:hypothetical protein
MLNLKRIVTLSTVMLGLLSVGLVSSSAATEKAKSYELSLNGPTKLGTQVLNAGDYKVKVEGSSVVFTNESSKATFSAPATLQAGTAKFDRTAVITVQDAGEPRIVSIQLKGGKDVLKLN